MGPVVILGVGAIGTWLAVRLARATEAPITLLVRRTQVETFQAQGLELELLPSVTTSSGVTAEVPTDPAERWHLPPERYSWRVTDDASIATRAGDPSIPSPSGDEDLLFVTCRAYQTREAALAAKALGLMPSRIVTLQNGLGNAEVLAEVFGAGRVVAGTTTHGVTSLGVGRARHAGAGRTRIGPWIEEGADPRPVAALLETGGIQTEIVPDAERLLWEKVIINAAINPLTAIHGVRNGELLARPDLRTQMEAAAREATAVARAEGLALDDDEMVHAASEVANATALNESSMLQARRAGRQLELDAITGEIVRRARAHGLEVPTNMALLDALR